MIKYGYSIREACYIFEFEGERLTVPDTQMLRESWIYNAICRMAMPIKIEEELFTHTLPRDIWDTLKGTFGK